MKKRRSPMGSITLCYHGISESWRDPLVVSQSSFQRQIRSLLDRGLVPVTGAQVLEGRSGTFHVTFDDAFVNIRPALDFLRSIGVPATIFACSGYAADGARLVLPEHAGRVEGHEHELETMTWDELRDLADTGFEIASHTVSHPHLPELSDRELECELIDSRRHIEDELGRTCRLLAYPYGESDDRVRAMTRRTGYDAAFEVDWQAPSSDAMALSRVGVYRETGAVRFWSQTSSTGQSIRRRVAAMRAAPALLALVELPEALPALC